VEFLPDSDQDALVEATREYIHSRFPLVDGPNRLDDVRWKEIAALGWLGLAADEQVGGAGATLLDEVFVFREIGRGLVCGPILTTLAAARLAAHVGRQNLAADLISGQYRVSRAVALPGMADELLLLDADVSNFTLVVDSDRVALTPTPHLLETHPGLEDGTLVARVERSAVHDAEISSNDPSTVRKLRRVLSILTSAQLAGIAGATTDLATAYAKDRVQFGKQIGAFQAIKHKCADMATNALAADNITFFAALTESRRGSDSDYHALAAAANTRRAAFANARTNIQIHGAMGFTVEDSAHRFVKRAHTLCVTEGFDQAAERLAGLPSADMSEDA
jgi:alkylation response protein AidB-like acyl-CoA dehydrogenase